MRMTYWYNDSIGCVYATHPKVKGFLIWSDYNSTWSHEVTTDSYHDFMSRWSDYHPVALKDVRSQFPTIKAFKYIEPQAQEAGTQPAIQ